MSVASPRTLSQLMRAGHHFTDRDFMRVLGVDHATLHALEAEPGLASLEQLFLLARLLHQPIRRLLLLAVGPAISA